MSMFQAENMTFKQGQGLRMQDRYALLVNGDNPQYGAHHAYQKYGPDDIGDSSQAGKNNEIVGLADC
jgi:hypothetical protein